MGGQENLAARALARLDTLPAAPTEGEFLSREEAAAIVDNTLAHIERHGDATERAYLSGHRKRLVETLTLTPKARHPDATFLDVGCYGYFGYWAVRHLGYARVSGIEMPLPSGEPRVLREVTVAGDTVTIDVHHFNLTEAEWPLDGGFETAVCLEVLEHVDHDPSGVLSRIRDRLAPDGMFVFSVPNAVSYKTLSEFLTGMPPWTYWFYNPDLAHEPRHSLEYTPFLASLVLDAAGFEQLSLKTINAYKDDEAIADLYAIGARLGRPAALFGETLIAVARKRDEKDVVRLPDALYSGDGYYRSTWPLVDPIRRRAIDNLYAEWTAADANARRVTEFESALAEKTSEAEALVSRLAEVESALAERTAGAEALATRVTEIESALAARTAEAEALVSRLAEVESALAAKTSEAVTANRQCASLEGELARTEVALGEMANLLDVYSRRLVEAESVSKTVHALTARVAELDGALAAKTAEADRAEHRRTALEEEVDNDREILLHYRLMAPAGVRKFAERAALPMETWMRHLRRHPAQMEEWRAIRRLSRRRRRGQNPPLLCNPFGSASLQPDGTTRAHDVPGTGSPEIEASLAQRALPSIAEPPPEPARAAAAVPPAPGALTTLPPEAVARPLEIPPYVAKNAAAYQIDIFRSFHERVNIAGLRVLEVGSDYHLATARLFAANGASRVVATNIGDWRSPEPVPCNLEFVVGDVADTGAQLGQFDVIYGIAVLEHLPDVPRVAAALRPLLAPGGIVFLQGEPIWGGSVGHHVWFDPEQGPDPVRFAAGGSRTAKPMRYAFSEPEANPIPDWAHLVLSPDEMRAHLSASGVPEAHAEGIVDYVYNRSGQYTGSCSNFQTATQIIAAFEQEFEVYPERNQYEQASNEFFERARESYLEDDLRTLGLRLWMRGRASARLR